MSILFISILILTSSTLAYGQVLIPRVGFYTFTCPLAEFIVTSAVKSAFEDNPTIAPGLLRMHFHDCFVNGCDGSILIDGTNSEKTAPANSLLRGFEVIEDAKAQLEIICPEVVSCADILALAARDSVVLTSGIGWAVQTGRRDGVVSLASDTLNNLPAFNSPVADQLDLFISKGLNIQDLVTLVGGHTIGTAACRLFSYRLQNFTANGGPDPSINPTFLPVLRSLCPLGGDGTVRVPLDDGSVGRFDTSFFANLRAGKGVLESDQVLYGDASTRTVVDRFLGLSGLLGLTFSVEFGKSMVNLGNVGVKTGTNGQIRKFCNRIN